MNAGKILQAKGGEVFTVSPGDTLLDAARVLDERKVGAVIAVDSSKKPVGVFSERDLARAVARSGAEALGHAVETVMTRGLITAGPGASIDELMGVMTDRRVRHIIIMDGDAMTGVVSIGDVVKRKIAQAEADAEALKHYIETA